MALAPGTRLGAYEILSALGAGGMGEVYRARDTRLGRDVALKILPEPFASDQERRARFEREAKLLAALNHPHIAQIHGIEESTGIRALVMELVDGEDLAQRIARGPLPLDEALAIAAQVCDALEAAHEQGIIHRDLKPANIKLRPDGTVKVLDFGLAKSAIREVEVANSPTFTRLGQGFGEAGSPTLVGVIMGTAAYMAPEQARGKAVDKRADIWAFGCVLYEMLTGSQAFGGTDVTEILAAVVKTEPEWAALPTSTPPHVRRLIEHCLSKDPRMRVRDIGDARILLNDPPASALPAPAESRPLWAWWTLTSALAIALAIVAAIAWRTPNPSASIPFMRLAVDLGAGAELDTGSPGHPFAISPDGTRLALILKGEGDVPQLGIRSLHQPAVSPLAGSDGAQTPFFSHDGRWIGFWAGGKVKKISVSGGPAITLCDAPALRGASWGDDGNIVAALAVTSGLVRIPGEGGKPEPLTELKTGERTHRWPHVLPGSRAVLFTAHVSAETYDDATIDAFSLPGRERTTVLRGGFSGRYLPSGHLVYAHKSTIFAAPFDVERLALAGAPVPVVDDVATSANAAAYFAASATGNFVYLIGRGAPSTWSIRWVEPLGALRPLHEPRGRYFSPRLSPDGKRLAFAIQGAQGEDIWVKSLDRGTLSRLSFLSGTNRRALWTPDGSAIVFHSTDPARAGIYWVRSDGSGEAVRLTESSATPHSFSSDGKRLALTQAGLEGSLDIFTASMEGNGARPRLGKPELFFATRFQEDGPRFSPDGRWIAYMSADSGRGEVWVRPYPGPGVGRQISTSGGVSPHWSAADRQLLFRAPDGQLMAVSYAVQGDTFAAGQPRVWSQTRLALTAGDAWDLAPDGKRVVAMFGNESEADQKPVADLTILLNFFEEVRRRVEGRGE